MSLVTTISGKNNILEKKDLYDKTMANFLYFPNVLESLYYFLNDKKHSNKWHLVLNGKISKEETMTKIFQSLSWHSRVKTEQEKLEPTDSVMQKTCLGNCLLILVF